MANLGNQKIKDTYQLVLQTDVSGNLQKLDGTTPNPFIVNGNLRYVDGNQANGYVLLSDASGNASWGAVVPGDIYISGGSINGTTIELNTTSGNTVSIPGLKWSANTDGSVSPSGDTTAVTLRDDINVVHGKSLNVDLNGSLGATILFQSTQTYFLQDIKLGDGDKANFGAGGDLQIYHNGSNGTIDNNTGVLQILSPNLTLGDGTSEVTVSDNLTVVGDITGATDLHIGRNITTTNNLTVNGDTLYGNSATGNVGVGNLNPTHKLTISGNTFNLIILAVGQSMVCTANDARVRFEGGHTTANLVAGMQLKIVDGNGITQTVTISSINSDEIFILTAPFPGSDVAVTTFRRSTTQNTNQFAVYSGSNTAFQVSGDVVMSGSTDLLDIFASSAITNQDVYWSANTDGTSITPSGGTTNTDIKLNAGLTAQTLNSNGTINTGQAYYSQNVAVMGYDGVINVGLMSEKLRLYGNNIELNGPVTASSGITASGNISASGNTNINGVLSGLTDARFGGNLGVSGRTFLGSVDTATATASDKILVVQSTGEIESITTGALTAFTSDYWQGNGSGTGIKPSGTTTNVDVTGGLGISGNTFFGGTLSGTGTVTTLSPIVAAQYNSTTSTSGYQLNGTKYLWRDGDYLQVGNTTGTVPNTDIIGKSINLQTATTINDNLTVTGNTNISGNTNINGVLSGLTDARFGGNLGVSGNTYLPNFQNGTTIIQCSFSLKTFSTNNWASHPAAQGGLNSEFWSQDTGVDTLPALYQYYNTQNPSAGNPSPSQGAFCAPATGKLRKIIFNGANSTGALKGDDLEIEIARAPVTDGQSGLSYTQLTGITHTLPDNTAKRFIIDCNFGGSGVDVAANDVFLVAFKTTEGSNAFIRVNLTAFFEYPLPIIT
jgi:hypothetical protein